MSQSSKKLFSRLQPERTSDRVAEEIRKTIVAGKLSPGENLPPERTLAERFGVTRNTVREALKILQQARLVSIRQGSGARVLDYLANAGFEFIWALFGTGEGAQAELVADLMQARAVVGEAIYHHAIDHFDAGVLGEVEAALDTLAAEAEKPRPDVRRLQELDFDVQHRLLCGGGNRTIILLHNSIRHVYLRMAQLFEPLVQKPKDLVAHYRRLLADLEAGNRKGAKQTVTLIFAEQQLAMAREK